MQNDSNQSVQTAPHRLGSIFARNLEALKRPAMANADAEIQVIGTRSQTAAASSHKGKSKAVKTTEEASPKTVVTENEDAQESDTSEEQVEDDEPEEEESSDDDVDNFTTSEIVTVLVGPKRKRFYLHRDLICQRSPFMEKCLSKNRFREGEKNELYLPEDDPKAFAIVVDWIYRGKLPGMTAGMRNLDVIDMSSAYCMADKFGMEELQNGIMDYIRTSYRVNSQLLAHSHANSHNHHVIGGHNSGSSRDAGRLGLMTSMSTSQSDREAAAASSPENTRPNYSATLLCHLTGPPKSPLKRFFIEHLVYHMQTFPRWYSNDFKTHSHSSLRVPNKHPATGSVTDDTQPASDLESFQKLYGDQDLALLIQRKAWQWAIERWGDPSKDKGCAYHVHSTTQCEYKKAAAAAMPVGAKSATLGARGGLSSSPNNPAALLQGLGGGRSQNWMGGPNAAAAGLIGGWHPGVGW